MKVAKWGNSLAVRLPAHLVSELGLAEGDDVEIRRAADGGFEMEKSKARDDFFALCEKLAEKSQQTYSFSRDDAYSVRRGGNDAD
ncbi:MAG: AbrB/MazE/SpoVT family DNA-binding domain-containing protein [Hyphomicrobium aestuarii]|nr:AbrB/MazE/SpoVT family DNA-binding domain-containing protein [Hyphomicrobium aestuarii]